MERLHKIIGGDATRTAKQRWRRAVIRRNNTPTKCARCSYPIVRTSNYSNVHHLCRSCARVPRDTPWSIMSTKTDHPAVYGQALTKVRFDRSLTIAQAAERLDMPVTTYYNLERMKEAVITDARATAFRAAGVPVHNLKIRTMIGLRHYRERVGISLQRLSDLTGLSRSTLRSVEIGERTCAPEYAAIVLTTLRNIAKRL